MIRPRSLKGILKPFNKMVADLDAHIASQNRKGARAKIKAAKLTAKADCHYKDADKAREALNVISAILPKG